MDGKFTLDMEKSIFIDALDYLRGEIDAVDIHYAISKMDTTRRSLANIDHELYVKMHDLLETFGDENDLPEGWWLDYGDLDDIIFKL